MTCRELNDFLLEYVSGELPPALRTAFDVHVGCCTECRVYLASYEITVKAGRAAYHDTAEPPMPEELVKAIVAARRATSG